MTSLAAPRVDISDVGVPEHHRDKLAARTAYDRAEAKLSATPYLPDTHNEDASDAEVAVGSPSTAVSGVPGAHPS